MDRRSFVARAVAAAPVLSMLTAARRAPFKDLTVVTVNHDGDKPVAIEVVGHVLRNATGGIYDKSQPLKLTTPATFSVNVESIPAVIHAEGNQFIRVVADHSVTKQHLYARARSVTIRKLARAAPVDANAPAMIELIGEGRSGT